MKIPALVGPPSLSPSALSTPHLALAVRPWRWGLRSAHCPSPCCPAQGCPLAGGLSRLDQHPGPTVGGRADPVGDSLQPHSLIRELPAPHPSILAQREAFLGGACATWLKPSSLPWGSLHPRQRHPTLPSNGGRAGGVLAVPGAPASRTSPIPTLLRSTRPPEYLLGALTVSREGREQPSLTNCALEQDQLPPSFGRFGVGMTLIANGAN